MDYRFRIFKGKDGKTFLSIKHTNGQTLLTSEGYERTVSPVLMLRNLIQGIRSYVGTDDEMLVIHTIDDREDES